MIETKTFRFVKWNQYFDKELFMFLLQGECKSIDYTGQEKIVRTDFQDEFNEEMERKREN